VAVKELCRKHGFSEASYYLWRSEFGGLEVSEDLPWVSRGPIVT
jgi:putative transposase